MELKVANRQDAIPVAGDWHPTTFPHLLVNELGLVFSTALNRVLKGSIIGRENNSYLSIGYKKEGKVKHFKVHILIATAFIPNPENKKCVNHLDGNKRNNAVSNLEWATHSENAIHAVAAGLKRTFRTRWGYTYSNIDCHLVLSLHKNKIPQKQIADRLGVDQSTISRLLNKIL